jgi:Tol biopolymer transport system component
MTAVKVPVASTNRPVPPVIVATVFTSSMPGPIGVPPGLHIFTLRKALGDTADNPAYVETIPKRGYRFKAPVRRPNDIRGSSDQGSRSPGNLSLPEQATHRFEGTAVFDAVGGERGRLSTRRIGMLTTSVLLGAALTSTVIHVSHIDTTNPLLRTLPLTSLPGRELAPAVSPDGSRVAFLWDGGEDKTSLDLYVQSASDARPLKLATGPARQPAWSPDGTRIAFLRYTEPASAPRRQEVLEVPTTGGVERKLAVVGAQQFGLDWSPDGRSLAVVDKPAKGAADALYLFSRRDGSKQQLTSPTAGDAGDCLPRFSPDGRFLAFVRVHAPSSADVFVLDLLKRSLSRVTRTEELVLGAPDWLPDGGGLIYSSARPQLGGLAHLWKVSLDGSPPQLLGDGFQPSLSRRDEPLMVYVRIQIDWNVWRLPGPLATSVASPGRLVESTQLDTRPQYSADGRKIAFNSNRSGMDEIWLSDSDGSNAARLTFLDRNDPGLTAAWSFDSEYLAFSAAVEGNADLYLIPAKGGFPSRVTRTSEDEGYPSFSRDGRWIYFSSRRSGSDQVWRVAREGGTPVQVTRNGGIDAKESPDGRFLYITKAVFEVGQPGIWRKQLPDGTEERIAAMGQALQWALLEDDPCYVKGPRSEKASIECLDVASRSIRWSAPLEGPGHLWGSLSVSPDGRWMLLDRRDSHQGDLMMVENFR